MTCPNCEFYRAMCAYLGERHNAAFVEAIEHAAIAAATGTAKTAQRVECEAAQSGGEQPHRPNAVRHSNTGDYRHDTDSN